MKISVTCKKLMALVLTFALVLSMAVIPKKASAASGDPSVQMLGVSLSLGNNNANAGTQSLRIGIKVSNASKARACGITVGFIGQSMTIGTSSAPDGAVDEVFDQLYSKDLNDDSVVYVLVMDNVPQKMFDADFEITGKAWGIDGTPYTSNTITKSINSAAASIAAAYPALGIVLKDDGILYKDNGNSELTAEDIANYAAPEVFTGTFVATGAAATFDVFHTQDYSTPSETNVTTAVARDSSTGEVLSDGNGQINFRVNVPEGYVVKDVTATEGKYNNIKGVAAGIYRVTKITGDLTITVELEPDSGIGPYDDGDDSKHTALFEPDENVTGIDVYHTQEITGTPDEVNASSAIARNSSTGEIDISGNGQVNFVVKTADGFVVDDVEVVSGTFTNVKTVDKDAGVYRITKITSDLKVSITTKAAPAPASPTPYIVKKFSAVSEIKENTEYAIVTGGTITPTGLASAYYYLKDANVENAPTLMGYAQFNEATAVVEETSLWKFEAVDDGYAMRAAAIADDSVAYLNVDSGVAKMGAKQKLQITYSNSNFSIKNGGNLLRFTNSGSDANGSRTPGFTGGTNTASSTWKFYEVVEEEVIPTPEPPFVKTDDLKEATNYAIVMPNIQPTGLSTGDFYLKDTNIAGTTLMDYASFDQTMAHNEVALWNLVQTGSGYGIRAVGVTDDSAAYLNIASGSVTLGPIQELSITVDGSAYIISNGSQRLRFTNSGNGGSTPGFTGGTNAASGTVVFYEAVN